MFTKEEIKTRWLEKRLAEVAKGNPEPEAGMALATFIASAALMDKKTRDGGDYIEHPLIVGMFNTKSTTKQIIGILHDVVEDSDWALDDLRDLGFSKRIVDGVDGVTKRPGELYFDFIVRCALTSDDSIDIKLDDLDHNTKGNRYPHLEKTEKQKLKDMAYNVAYFYLVAIKKGEIEKGTSVKDFMKTVPAYAEKPNLMEKLLQKFTKEGQKSVRIQAQEITRPKQSYKTP